MAKKLTKPQLKALDALATFTELDLQVASLYTLWPTHQLRQNKLAELDDAGLIEWIPDNQTSFGPRWWVTEAGIQALVAHRFYA